MLNLKLGEKELKIKFTYEATVRSGIMQRLVSLEESDDANSLQKVLEIIPEMILVGSQKFHKDEFGYNYETGEGKEESLSKVYSLVDDYFDQDDSDFMWLLDTIRGEMLQNGFLSKLYHQEKETQGKKKN